MGWWYQIRDEKQAIINCSVLQLQGPQMRQNSMDLFLQDLLGGGQSSEPKRDQHCCSNDGYQSEVSSNASSVGSESSSGWINNSRQQHSANTSGMFRVSPMVQVKGSSAFKWFNALKWSWYRYATNCTRWGGHLLRRFCKKFLRFPRVLDCTAAAMVPKQSKNYKTFGTSGRPAQ